MSGKYFSFKDWDNKEITREQQGMNRNQPIGSNRTREVDFQRPELSSKWSDPPAARETPDYNPGTSQSEMSTNMGVASSGRSGYNPRHQRPPQRESQYISRTNMGVSSSGRSGYNPRQDNRRYNPIDQKGKISMQKMGAHSSGHTGYSDRFSPFQPLQDSGKPELDPFPERGPIAPTSSDNYFSWSEFPEPSRQTPKTYMGANSSGNSNNRNYMKNI